MNRWFISARRVITIVLLAVALFVTPIINFGQSMHAQAATTRVEQSFNEDVDPAAIRRIQEKAEDLGDNPAAGRDIGETGLKNLRKLGENIPETLDLNRRQKGAMFKSDDVRDLDRAQKQAERN